MSISKSAAALGRRGGRSKSPRKRAASVANFAKARAAKAAKKAQCQSTVSV